jgi:pilus assembly protein Flp/PilA
MLKFTGTAIRRSFLRFARCDSGATAIEYALIASGIAVAISTTVFNLGSKVNGLFVSVSTSLK